MLAKFGLLALATLSSALFVANVDADTNLLGLVSTNTNVGAVVAKRDHAHRRQVAASVDLDIAVSLDNVLSVVSPLVQEIEGVAQLVGTVADQVIADKVEPILKQLTTAVSGVVGELSGATQQQKRALAKRDLAQDLAPKVTQLFQEVANILNTAETIVQSVPIVGGILGPILLQLNPLLSQLLTLLNNLVAGLLALVGAALNGILGGLSPLLGGLLGGLMGGGLLGGL